MTSDIQSRTTSALSTFDSNMSSIYNRAVFFDADLYGTKSSSQELSLSQLCFKWTLLAANLLFAIFGVTLLAVGAYALNNPVGALSGQTIPQGLIAMGVFILILSMLGAVAAWTESRGLLFVYFLFLLLLTIILFFVGIAVYVKRNSASDYINSGWQSASPDLRLSMELAFSCCGLLSYNDTWAAQPCPGTSTSSSGQLVTAPPALHVACSSTLSQSFQNSFATAGGCGIGFAVVMMLGMVFVCVLMRGISRRQFEKDLASLRHSNDSDPNNVQLEEGDAQNTDGGEQYDQHDEHVSEETTDDYH